MAWLSYALILTSFTTLSFGAILENVADLNKLNLKFDFIIVGGGTAGNVVANHLSENWDVSVLVLEAGGSNVGVTNIIVPAFAAQATPNTPLKRCTRHGYAGVAGTSHQQNIKTQVNLRLFKSSVSFQEAEGRADYQQTDATSISTLTARMAAVSTKRGQLHRRWGLG
ncbi:hypothetical protein B0H14DRAFT_2624926 [Mycena olivaceomarginata]|nr:hypothetical protein B0H14DRAFT_2624926 [Mycena olivaceomarginata]